MSRGRSSATVLRALARVTAPLAIAAVVAVLLAANTSARAAVPANPAAQSSAAVPANPAAQSSAAVPANQVAQSSAAVPANPATQSGAAAPTKAALLASSSTAPSATAPASRPTTVPVKMVGLAEGTVRLAVPEDWPPIGQPTGDGASFRSPDGAAILSLGVSHLQDALPESGKMRLAEVLIKALKEDGQKQGFTFLYGPRMEFDELLFLKVRDRHRQKDHIADRYHFYRLSGINLVMAAITIWDRPPDQSQWYAQQARQALLQMQIARAKAKKW